MSLNRLPKKDQQKLDNLYQTLGDASAAFAGYPCNLDFDYSELHRFLDYSINNVGDPFAKSNYRVNTHEIEREVLDWFADITKAGKGYRGYITHGGSESNLFGLNIANKLYPEGIIYYSEHTHYSVEKIISIMNAKGIKVSVLKNGELDYQALSKKLAENSQHPAIIMANIGTTMTGAVDDIKTIKTLLKNNGIKQSYIHCDAAFSGMILPFVDDPQAFRFSDGIDSIAISGHKFIGSPIPCGIALVRKGLAEKVGRYVEYVDIVDSTIAGSRNGIAPLFLWYAIKSLGVDGFKERVNNCLENTRYLMDRLEKSGIPAWCNENSIIVVIPKPEKAFAEKWQLACHEAIAHIIVCPHMDKSFIDRLCSELEKESLAIEKFDIQKAKGQCQQVEKRFHVGKFLGVIGICASTAFAFSQFDMG